MEKKGFDTDVYDQPFVSNSWGRRSEFMAEHIHLWMECYEKGGFGSTQKKLIKWSTPSGSDMVRKMKGCTIYCRMSTINMSVSI